MSRSLLRSRRPWPALALALAAGLLACRPGRAADFVDPPTFSSSNGSLSVLMIAAKRPHVAVGSVTTDLWTYEICYLPAPGANACPNGTGQAGLAGVRLALQPGDTLRIRLVNDLSPLNPADADHVADHPTLVGNPTNLHTHGLIVEPHKAVSNTDSYGDYVFIEIRNKMNPIPAGERHPGIDIVEGAAEYVYNIEPTHPTGLYWFHPHLHGLSLNQVSAGMSGALTVGNPADGCGDRFCADAIRAGNVRHLVLRDTQVAPGGLLKTQEEPAFCAGGPSAGRLGSCEGQQVDPSDPSSDYRGGTWLHTVSGQVYPTINVGAMGDVWRILNASGSRSYALSLQDQRTGAKLPLQLLAIDGVTLDVDTASTPGLLARRLAHKAVVTACPAQLLPGSLGRVCVESINMMPSSRVEVRVVNPSLLGPPRNAVLRTADYATGDAGAGDVWPQIDLAAVTLPPRGLLAPPTVLLQGIASAMFASGGHLMAPALLQLPGRSQLVPAATAGSAPAVPSAGPPLQSIDPAPSAAISPAQLSGAMATPNCTPLPAGHHRKLLFGYPQPTTFGLGYVEVDQNGHDIEATRVPITEFDPAKPTICIPLPHAQPVAELWELQNTTSEDHNFHIHQTRFFVVDGGVLPGQTIPQMLNGTTVLLDNVPVPRPANGAPCDGTMDSVRSGACVPSKTFVVIPFRELGDFVFHCHILEHEDGGMMARIRVVATP